MAFWPSFKPMRRTHRPLNGPSCTGTYHERAYNSPGTDGQRRHIDLRRTTIGLLAENNWLKNESIQHLFLGVADACERRDANLIRFGYMNANELLNVESQHLVITDLIRQFELDGLIFLGWTIPVQGEYLERLKRTVRIPMFSIGKRLEGLPSNFMHGGYYLRKLLLHLIKKHGYRRIGYICPWSYDGRNDIYKRTLEKHGLFDPSLYVGESELKGLNMYDRAQRAVSILLDERKAAPDVVIAMTMEEAYTVQMLLKARGLRIPDDVAICSYEDGQRTRYVSPSITSIYFPIRELADSGTERLLEWIRTGVKPGIHSVAGRIEYRESCGCQLSRSLEEYEREIFELAKQNEEKDYYQRLMEEINQMIMTSYKSPSLLHVLAAGLEKLNIANCSVFRYSPGSRSFGDCLLAFETIDELRIAYPKPVTFEERKKSALFPRDRRFTYAAELLHVADEHYGFMLIEASSLDIRNYLSLASHMGTAMNSIDLIARLEAEIELKNRNEIRLSQLAQFDPLTNLYNRSSFQEILALEAGKGSPFSLLYIDLDGFKPVNDRYGHEAGDLLLVAIADRISGVLEGRAIVPDGLNSAIPPRSAVFRLGGDEFTAILSIVGEDELKRLSETIIGALREPFDIQGRPVVIGASIGISRYPADSADPRTLVQYADSAMYRSKASRQRFSLHS